MASQPFEGRKPTGITNGTRITSTAVGLANIIASAIKNNSLISMNIQNKTLNLWRVI